MLYKIINIIIAQTTLLDDFIWLSNPHVVYYLYELLVY